MKCAALTAQRLVSDLVPRAPAPAIRQAARLLKDGPAASRQDLDTACPGLWAGLERRLRDRGMYEKCEYLKSLSEPDTIHGEIKRGLLGDLTGEYT